MSTSDNPHVAFFRKVVKLQKAVKIEAPHLHGIIEEVDRLYAELGELRPAVHANKVQAEEILQLTSERKRLLALADLWDRAISVAYNEYSHGQRAAYESAAGELREALGHEQHPYR